MSQNIIINGVTYNGVNSLEIPKSVGGIAVYNDISDSTVTADKLAEGETAYAANGVKIIGTMLAKYAEAETEVAQFGNVSYKSVQKALDEASASGGVVTLIANAIESGISVASGVTLDLNGYTLTANNAIGFDNSHIIDNSTTNAGILKCSQVILNKSNSQMPIWNGVDGYVFVAMKNQAKTPTISNDTFTVTFRPAFGTVHATYFSDGASDNGITICCEFEWDAGSEKYSQLYTYSDDSIATTYGNNKAFVFNVTNVSAYPNYKVRLKVTSNTGVIWTVDFN